MMMQERAVWLSSKGKPRKQITFSSLLTRRKVDNTGCKMNQGTKMVHHLPLTSKFKIKVIKLAAVGRDSVERFDYSTYCLSFDIS
jgi:hypothetical protein